MSAVYPDPSAVAGAQGLRDLVGSLLTVALIFACLVIAVSAVAWAISHSTGNIQAAARARTGIWVGLGGAALTGSAVAFLNLLVDLGRTF